MWIRIQEQGNLPKLPNKPDIHPIKKASQLFVEAKSDQDPDSHGSALVWSGSHYGKKLDPDPH